MRRLSVIFAVSSLIIGLSGVMRAISGDVEVPLYQIVVLYSSLVMFRDEQELFELRRKIAGCTPRDSSMVCCGPGGS